MEDLLSRFRAKLTSLEKSTEEIDRIFNSLKLESGSDLKSILTGISSRLSVIESDIKDMKINIENNTQRLDDNDAKTAG